MEELTEVEFIIKTLAQRRGGFDRIRPYDIAEYIFPSTADYTGTAEKCARELNKKLRMNYDPELTDMILDDLITIYQGWAGYVPG